MSKDTQPVELKSLPDPAARRQELAEAADVDRKERVMACQQAMDAVMQRFCCSLSARVITVHDADGRWLLAAQPMLTAK